MTYLYHIVFICIIILGGGGGNEVDLGRERVNLAVVEARPLQQLDDK